IFEKTSISTASPRWPACGAPPDPVRSPHDQHGGRMACPLQREVSAADVPASPREGHVASPETSRLPAGTTGVISRASPTKDHLMVELRVQSLGLDQVSKTPVVILQ